MATKLVNCKLRVIYFDSLTRLSITIEESSHSIAQLRRDVYNFKIGIAFSLMRSVEEAA